jgi:glycerol-3-phosphate acyltransferase PlsX
MDFPAEYQGFVEGDDIPMGTVNVVVTDGFTGNVALKVGEGVGSLMNHFLKDELKSTLKARMGAFLAMGALKRLKRRMDPRHYNGGMFLGLNGICVKSHGGMDSYGFSRAIAMAASLVENGFNTRVCQEIESLMSQDAFVASLVTEAEGVAT